MTQPDTSGSEHYPDSIHVVLSEEELVFLQVVLGALEGSDPRDLAKKLRAVQVAAFARAHG